MTMTHTRTRVHTTITFANPHLVCGLCRKPVRRWHDSAACGCAEECWNEPCDHSAEVVSICPSWSPVDGCTCLAMLGSVDHAPAQAVV